MLNILRQTAAFFAGQEVEIYLVGGSLRNLVLGEPCVDWDLVATGDAHKLARHLADYLGGFYAYLHAKASRVVVRDVGSECVLDIAPLRGSALAEDLYARDFTVNALAVPLADALDLLAGDRPLGAIDEVMIDLVGGLADLRRREVRVVSAQVFQDDPLRMLRALRLVTRYGLTIESGTERLIKRDAALLMDVAAERVHEELYRLLSYQGSLKLLHHLDEYGLLTVLFPELQPARGMRQPQPHYWDVFEHSLQSVGMQEELGFLLAAAPETPLPANLAAATVINEDLTDVRELLHEAEQQEIFHFTDLQTPRMKLAALLHDIGKPPTCTISEQGAIHFYNHPQIGAPIVGTMMRRLSVSTQDRRLVQLLAAHHMRPGQLGQEGEVTQRAIRRYFVDLGPTGILVALFSLADHLATLGPQAGTQSLVRHLKVVRLLLTRYIRERSTTLPPRLVRPDELMSRLKLKPGPLLGQLLEEIAEAQAEGTIHSREEAIWLARESLHES